MTTLASSSSFSLSLPSPPPPPSLLIGELKRSLKKKFDRRRDNTYTSVPIAYGISRNDLITNGCQDAHLRALQWNEYACLNKNNAKWWIIVYRLRSKTIFALQPRRPTSMIFLSAQTRSLWTQHGPIWKPEIL